jgi:hypothetical protein
MGGGDVVESSPAAMRSRWWELSIAIAAGAGVLAAVAFAIAVALPPTIVNLRTAISDGVSPFILEQSNASAEVTLPADWIVERKDAADLLVWTPDGRMSAIVTLTLAAPLTALEDVVDVDAALRTEVLASGLTVVHADRRGRDGVAAAVSLADTDTGGPTLLVATTVPDDADPDDYDLALAELLDGVG